LPSHSFKCVAPAFKLRSQMDAASTDKQ
jgi:hypothetical protein